jgi:chorismate mutase/prephenate dehydratase
MADDKDGKVDQLREIRAQIDTIDRELQRLISARAACVLRVAEVKTADSGDEAPVFYRPEREAEILTRVKRENTARCPTATWHTCSARSSRAVSRWNSR